MQPALVGRAIEHAVGVYAGCHHVEEELEEDIAARLGAGGLGLRGYEGAHHAAYQQVLVQRAEHAALHILPPAYFLILVAAALTAAGHELQDLLFEEGQLLWREAAVGKVVDELLQYLDLGPGAGEVGQCDERGLAIAGQQDAVGRGEIVVAGVQAAIRCAERDALHRFRHMLVKAGKEAEAMLTGERLTCLGILGALYIHRAGLAAGVDGVFLIDLYVVAPLYQLVGGAHACYAAAEYQYFLFDHLSALG